MRAVVITKHGPPRSCRSQERPRPGRPAGPGARSTSRRPASTSPTRWPASGLYADAPKPPTVVGYEVAGDGRGGRARASRPRASASASWPAPASAATPRRSSCRPPTSSRSPTRCPSSRARRSRSTTRRRGRPCIGYGTLQAGERVLIHAAAGGVGIAATQIAKRPGAEVYGTASPGKHDGIRGFGVDHPLDYTQRRLGAAASPPFDLVMDALGGASFRRTYDLLRPGGRLVAFGASSVLQRREAQPASRRAPQALRMLRGFNLIKQMSESKAVIGLNMLTLWDDRGTLEPWIAPLQAMLDDGTLAAGRLRGRPVRPRRRRAPHHRRAAQRREGRAGALGCRAGTPRAQSCRRLLDLRLLLLPRSGGVARGGRLKPQTQPRRSRTRPRTKSTP